LVIDAVFGNGFMIGGTVKTSLICVIYFSEISRIIDSKFNLQREMLSIWEKMI